MGKFIERNERAVQCAVCARCARFGALLYEHTIFTFSHRVVNTREEGSKSPRRELVRSSAGASSYTPSFLGSFA